MHCLRHCLVLVLDQPWGHFLFPPASGVLASTHAVAEHSGAFGTAGTRPAQRRSPQSSRRRLGGRAVGWSPTSPGSGSASSRNRWVAPGPAGARKRVGSRGRLGEGAPTPVAGSRGRDRVRRMPLFQAPVEGVKRTRWRPFAARTFGPTPRSGCAPRHLRARTSGVASTRELEPTRARAWHSLGGPCPFSLGRLVPGEGAGAESGVPRRRPTGPDSSLRPGVKDRCAEPPSNERHV
jgi:hypothetical protein